MIEFKIHIPHLIKFHQEMPGGKESKDWLGITNLNL